MTLPRKRCFVLRPMLVLCIRMTNHGLYMSRILSLLLLPKTRRERAREKEMQRNTFSLSFCSHTRILSRTILYNCFVATGIFCFRRIFPEKTSFYIKPTRNHVEQGRRSTTRKIGRTSRTVRKSYV